MGKVHLTLVYQLQSAIRLKNSTADFTVTSTHISFLTFRIFTGCFQLSFNCRQKSFSYGQTSLKRAFQFNLIFMMCMDPHLDVFQWKVSTQLVIKRMTCMKEVVLGHLQ